MEAKTYRTQKNQIRGLKKSEYIALRALCRLSKNLYNVALYSVRQYYIAEKKFLRYESNYHACKENENYKLLNTDIAQQTMKVVDRSFHSFFGLMKKDGEYRYQNIRLPNYLPKDGFFLLIIPRPRIKDGYLDVSMSRAFRLEYGDIKIPFPKRLEGKNIKEVRIHPRFDARFFEIEFVYEDTKEPQVVDSERAMAIDLGLDNLATCVTTDGASFIVDGKYLKSINHQYNKRMAHLNSIRPHQGNDKYTALQCRLTIQRNSRIRDYMNKAARHIIDFCVEHHIGTLAVGYNPDWKRHINIGKRNNQNFVAIPHGALRLKMKNLCARYGIRYFEQEESYTSKASFLDNDILPEWSGESKEYAFSGRRVHRGLYVSKSGVKLNADVNGACNLLRKSKQKVNLDRLCTGDLASPLRVRLR
ncbi:IS200/IS605 family element transposase accessory protein TnpB [Candidatus Poribacteria bacterium]|nr:IS200/IS605 family element transposase accessory protein TnpB [Candidatus Poribacteria bacterium]